MKRLTLFLLGLSLALILIPLIPGNVLSTDVSLNNTIVKVYFSPHGGTQKAIIRQIDQATREILLQSYIITSKPIESALIGAGRRGVYVEVLLDKGMQKERKYTTAKILKAAGITVLLDDRHTCAHNKIIIIDREIIITGSSNFTYAAEVKNAENVLIIPSAELAGIYTDNFLKHRGHSLKY